MPAYFDIDRLYTTKGQEKNFDSEPKEGSVNYISSGSVYAAIQELKDSLETYGFPDYDTYLKMTEAEQEEVDQKLNSLINSENPVSAKTATTMLQLLLPQYSAEVQNVFQNLFLELTEDFYKDFYDLSLRVAALEAYHPTTTSADTETTADETTIN